ncbi:MAG: lipid-binding SYLF domain-containing protein [Desulfobacterota bacterium]|nr:lipid-binding SYLF domain-containing protein [Thermodesulfobacteriota bacterium]
MKTRSVVALFSLLSVSIFVIMGAFTHSWAATPALEAKKVVENSRYSLEAFMTDPANKEFQNLIKKAQGLYITPSLLKGAFVVGVSGGSGVLLIKDKNTGKWMGPAFYTLGGASFGIQAGGEASEVVLLIMTERGVKSFMKTNFKLGADVGIAAGPVGGGVAAETANLSADILSFSRSKGLFGGVSLEGAVVKVRGAYNEAYYGKKLSPSQILIGGRATNAHAQGLLEEITKATGEK